MPTPHNKVRISGTMPGGEVWSINPCFGRTTGEAVDNYDDLQDWAENIAQLNGGNVFTPVQLELLSTAARITSIRTEYYGLDGSLFDVAEVGLNPTVPGTFAPDKPFQSAVVASLRTLRPGRSFRGRLYFPALNVDLDTSTLRIPTAVVSAMANETADWIGDLAAADLSPTVLQPVIVSQTLGINTPIVRVEVGNIIDVQRRRRDSLEEQYQSAPLVSA